MSQIKLTEQDLHMLVEDAVKIYLQENSEQEGWWGGVKNAYQGAFGRNDQGEKNWNFNFGQTYRSGRYASSFDSYVQQIGKAIQGMQQVATKSGNQEINKDLDDVLNKLNDISVQFKTQATNIANGNQKNMWVQNPWETERRMKQNQFNDQMNAQQNQFNDQMNAQQKKYDRLNTRYKNYKKRNPQQTAMTGQPTATKTPMTGSVPKPGTVVPGAATATTGMTATG